MITTKNALPLALCAGVLLASLSYILLTTAGDGSFSIAESDTVLYLQYAKNTAIGQPYVYSPGDAPSTGSTTHLYPFILSLVYRLGASDSAALTAVYALNSLFYLCIIALTWLIAKKIAPRAAPLALFLTVLSGQTLSASLRMTDIGFFTMLALATYAALLYRKHLLTLTLILLCAVSRPEGFIFSFAFLLSGLIALVRSKTTEDEQGERQAAFRFFSYGILGATVFLITLYINYRLTGYFQFMSVANKGYFKIYPFVGALQETLFDLLEMIKGILFGLQGTHRQFYLLPVISGMLGMAGIMLYPRTRVATQRAEWWLALSAGAVLLLVASSQWQGISNDRYLAWLMPIWIMYVSIGVYEIHDRLKAPSFLPICTFLLIAYQFVTIAYMAGDAYTTAIMIRNRDAFALEVAEKYPHDTRFGNTSGGGLNSLMPDHTVFNLSGILSPDFFEPHGDQRMYYLVDLLKKRPELRFDYWITTEHFIEHNPWAKEFIGLPVKRNVEEALTRTVLSSVLYEADWTCIDGGSTPVLVKDELANMALIDQIDVGYLPDEEAHHYEVMLRLKNCTLTRVVKTDQLGHKEYAETGRFIMGSESFVVQNLDPQKPLKVVMRTGKSAEGSICFGRSLSSISSLEIDDSLSLRLFANGQEIPCPAQDISGEGFKELVLEIPAEQIQTDTLDIKMVGDHLSYAYWFYQ